MARAVVPDSDAYDNPTYLGYVRTTEVKPIVPVAIHFIADGEEVYKEPAWPLGTPYTISSSTIEACTRPTGTLDKWYTDASYSDAGRFTEDSFTPSDVNKRDYYIYCRNKYTVRFAFADDTRAYFGEHAPYAEEALSTRIYESAADEGLIMVPSAVERWHGDALGTLSWHRTTGYVARTDAGGAMKSIAVQSVFGEASATESSRPVASSAKVKASATLYVVWKRPTYDGFDSN